MHNTVTVDGQTASVPAGPFAWATRADARVELWWTGRLVDFFAGSHDGFLRLPEPALHRRRVVFVRGGYWVIVDTIESDGAHEATAHFHLAPGAVVSPRVGHGARIAVRRPHGVTELDFQAFGDVDALEWGDEWVSPIYGARTAAPGGRLISRGVGRRVLITVLAPAGDGGNTVVRELPCSGGRAISVDRPGVHDVIVLREEDQARIGTMQVGVDLALVRRGSPSYPVSAVALVGQGGRLEVDSLIFQADGVAELIRAGGGWSVVGEGRVVSR
jgi:hypothetical protein